MADIATLGIQRPLWKLWVGFLFAQLQIGVPSISPFKLQPNCDVFMPINLKCCSICNALRRNLKGEFGGSPFLRLGGAWVEQWSRELRQSNRKSKFFSTATVCRKSWPEFQCQFMPAFDPCLGIRMDLGGRKYYQLKCRPHIPIWHLYTLYTYLAPFGHNTPANDRQSDRNRPPMLQHRRPNKFLIASYMIYSGHFLRCFMKFSTINSTLCWKL